MCVLWIAGHPELYRLRPGDYRRINLRVFPYYIPYIVREETLWVLAVAHASRKPHYWISRHCEIACAVAKTMDPKTKVKGVCRLCQKATYLVESHIVSKFLLRRNGLIGKPKAKFDIICPADSNESDLHRQDGIKEPLLCQRCDNEKFGAWERYASQQFSRAKPQFKEARMPGFVWQGLDYAQMKLFFLSILWRMGIASHQFYGHVQLGKHEKHLRRMLIEEDPMESWRYGCAIGYLRFGDKTFGGVFSQPQMSSIEDGLTCIRFVMDGLVYFFYLTRVRPESSDLGCFLQTSGSWVVPFEQAKAIKFVWDEINQFRKHHGLWTDDDLVPSSSK